MNDALDLESAEADLRLMNAYLDIVGKIADRIGQAGYDVKMTLWAENTPGSTVHGRLQGNVAKARIEKK